jgi:hypothetical protein
MKNLARLFDRPSSFVVRYQELPVLALPECVRILTS